MALKIDSVVPLGKQSLEENSTTIKGGREKWFAGFPGSRFGG
jgi:hypothetical protein